MPFEKVDTQVDFPAQERAILAFWERTQAFDALRAQNKDGPRWSFLDGPITANNPMGVHHAWGRTYKDAFQRYHAMNGCHQACHQEGNYQSCQGLWVEVEVEEGTQTPFQALYPREPQLPGDTFASIQPPRTYEAIARSVRSLRPCPDRAITSIRAGLLDGLGPQRRRQEKRPTAGTASYPSPCRRRTTTIWTFREREVSRRRHAIAATTRCRGVRAVRSD